MKRLVNEFRDYARLPAAELKPVDLNGLVSDVLHLYAREGGERGDESARVPIKMDVDPNCPKIMGDAHQLRQVIHNLLQNAQDATEGCPVREVTIKTQWNEASRRARLIVQDTGAGFPDHILKRAFEPYVTTKAKGTGPGPGRGQENCGRTRRPRRPEKSCRGWGRPRGPSVAIIRSCGLATPAPSAAGQRWNEMANILVVDDELGIRDLLSEILNDEGHNVELAENAAQARGARNRARPDLVLLDIWMPDTDGVTLLKEWSTTGLLSMPVIMMSGHATIETAVEATKIGAQSFLEKPITMQKLLKAVEAGLARSSGIPPRKPGVAGVSPAPVVELTVEAAMTGGQSLPPVVEMGPQARQLFELDKPLRDARDEFEKCYFEFHLAKEGGSMTRVAEKTGLERTHLYRKLKQLGVDLSRGKRGG